jgi:hypothetical protein
MINLNQKKNLSFNSDIYVQNLESYNNISKYNCDGLDKNLFSYKLEHHNDQSNILFYPLYHKKNHSFLLKFLHTKNCYILVHIDIKLIKLLELAKYNDYRHRKCIILECILAY